MSRREHSPLDETRAARIREEADLNAEFEAHRAHRIDDLVAEGLTPEEAERRAAAEFGNVERLKSESRGVRAAARTRARRASRWDALWQDVRYAARRLRRGPLFTTAALATLGIGIGATVTITSIVKAVVLDPLPFADPDQVVLVEMLTPDGAGFSVSEGSFVDWRREVGAFEGMAAVVYRGGTLRSPGQPSSIAVARISHDFFDVLGIEAALGRGFFAEEDVAGAPAQVAMLSHEKWRTDFAADPNVIGSRLDIDGDRYDVVGVAPADLDIMTGGAPVFAPMGPNPSLDREDHYLDVVARLAPGSSIESASIEVAALQERLSQIHNADIGWGTRVVAARTELIGETVERAGWVLLMAAAVLMLMACVNVANLLMVRSTTREREMSVRMAIGASRNRLARQLFTESACLGLGGGALGLLVASLAVPAVRSMGAARIPRIDTATVDGASLFAGITMALVVTLICGLAPMLQLRLGKESVARGTRGIHDPGRLTRSILVSTQVALTVVLLTGTGLLFRSFTALTSVDPGFDADGTLAFSMNMPDESWDWRERSVLLPEVLDAVRGMPGVVAVGATPVAPFSGGGLANFVAPEDQLPDRAADFTPIHWRTVTPDFFNAMGIELLAGRDFRVEDGDAASPIIIGRSLAEHSWGDRDPIGRTMVWGDPGGSRMTVVGVVDDLRDVRLGETPPMIVYRPYRQIPWATMTAVVRYAGTDPTAIAAGIRPQVASVVSGLPVGEIESLEANLDRAVAEPRFNLQILGGFALCGLLLAIVGLYGLTAFDVRKRVPEIGIRLSLGASPSSVLALIVRSRFVTTGLGLAVGTCIAWVGATKLEALLYEIGPRDPVTWIGALTVIVGTSLIATYVPARGALKVQPSEALNAE